MAHKFAPPTSHVVTNFCLWVLFNVILCYQSISAVPEQGTDCFPSGQAVVPVSQLSLNNGLAIVPVDRLSLNKGGYCPSGHAVVPVSQLSTNEGKAVVPVDRLSLIKGLAIMPMSKLLLKTRDRSLSLWICCCPSISIVHEQVTGYCPNVSAVNEKRDRLFCQWTICCPSD